MDGTPSQDGRLKPGCGEQRDASRTLVDDLAARALAGDTASEGALFSWLRERFLAVAKRRLAEDDCEDVVQDALRVIHARLPARGSVVATLPWSLLVLRNVIGNHYQRRRRAAASLPLEDAPSAAMAASAREEEVEEVVRAHLSAAIVRLARDQPRCGRIFDSILAAWAEGGSQREISARAMARVQNELPDLTATGFYVALHRCRARLRAVLAAMEGGAGEGMSPMIEPRR